MSPLSGRGSEIRPGSVDEAREAPHGTVLLYPGVKRNTIAVGGGKGGVGKSIVTTSFAVGLSKRGNKVLLIDADFGAPNLHTLLGMTPPRASLSTYLTGAAEEIGSVISRTPVPNLELISSARDPLDAADVRKEAVKRIKEGLKAVDHDYILLDLAPGTSATVIELFNMAETGVAVTTPEPTSVENTYRFLKCVFLGKMKKVINHKENAALKQTVGRVFSNEWKGRVKTFGDILAAVKTIDAGHARFLRDAIGHTGVNLLVNKVRSSRDEGLGGLLKKASSDYFNLELGSLGSLKYAPEVMDMVAERRQVAADYETSVVPLGVEDCLERLLDKKMAGRQAHTRDNA